MTQHPRKHAIRIPIQDYFPTPGRVADHMMQRLMHALHVVTIQSRGHRLHDLAFARRRDVAIRVPCGFRQANDICRRTFLLRARCGFFASSTGTLLLI